MRVAGKTHCPSPGSARIGVLAEERAGQLDPAGAMLEVGFVLAAHPLEVGEQVCPHRGRQHGGAILVPLAVADGELARREVNMLHAQATAFQQPHPAGSVEWWPRGLASRMAMSWRATYGIGTRPRKAPNWIHRTGSIARGPDCGRLPKEADNRRSS